MCIYVITRLGLLVVGRQHSCLSLSPQVLSINVLHSLNVITAQIVLIE